ncbi:MAG: hypothetical protein JSS09_01145, partial [Verrucomicrobia bacterium]|nr:hypothetical protein [Verrucomicrobiota bacterium]
MSPSINSNPDPIIDQIRQMEDRAKKGELLTKTDKAFLRGLSTSSATTNTEDINTSLNTLYSTIQTSPKKTSSSNFFMRQINSISQIGARILGISSSIETEKKVITEALKTSSNKLDESTKTSKDKFEKFKKESNDLKPLEAFKQAAHALIGDFIKKNPTIDSSNIEKDLISIEEATEINDVFKSIKSILNNEENDIADTLIMNHVLQNLSTTQSYSILSNLLSQKDETLEDFKL